MENLTARVAKILGVPSETSWSQLFAFIPPDEIKKEKRGTFLVAFSFSGGEETQAASFGREILSRLNEEYYGELETDVLTKLKETVSRVSQEVGSETTIEIVAGAIKKDILYLAIFGKGEVWLFRNGKLGRILKGEGDLTSASGKLLEGDLFILGTSQVFSLSSEGVLRVAFETGSLQDAVETLTPTLLGKEEEAGVAAIIAKVEKEIVFDESDEVVVLPAELAEVVPEEHPPVLSRQQAGGGEEIQPKSPETFAKRPSFLAKIKEKISQFPGKKVYLRQQEDDSKKKKVNLTIAIILIGLLGISLFFGTKKRNADQKETQFKTLSSEINSLLDESQGLAALNPSRSQEIYLQAQGKYNQIKALAIHQDQLNDLKNKIDQVQNVAVREKKIDNLPVYYDLGLITSNVKGEKLTLIDDKLFVLDESANRVLSLNLVTKANSVLVGGSALSGSKLLSGESKLYVLEDEGVAEIASGKASVILKKDEGWQDISAMGNFNTSLYLVDRGAKNFWRYLASDSGFGSKKAWFTAEQEKLVNANSLAIDGSLWIGTNDGKIYKFTQGEPADYVVSGLDKAPTEISALYTNADIENLFVLDSKSGRLLVLGKTGEFVNAYVWSGLNQVTDIVVWQKEKKIILLSGDKLYEISFN